MNQKIYEGVADWQPRPRLQCSSSPGRHQQAGPGKSEINKWIINYQCQFYFKSIDLQCRNDDSRLVFTAYTGKIHFLLICTSGGKAAVGKGF